VSRLATYTLDGLGPAYAYPAWLPTRSRNTTIRAQVSTLERGLSRLVLAQLPVSTFRGSGALLRTPALY